MRPRLCAAPPLFALVPTLIDACGVTSHSYHRTTRDEPQTLPYAGLNSAPLSGLPSTCLLAWRHSSSMRHAPVRAPHAQNRQGESRRFPEVTESSPSSWTQSPSFSPARLIRSTSSREPAERAQAEVDRRRVQSAGKVRGYAGPRTGTDPLPVQPGIGARGLLG